LVDDQFAAAADEDRRAFDQARPVLLVAAGREPPNASAVHRYAADNCDVTATDGIAGLFGCGQNRLDGERKQGGVCDELAPKAGDSVCRVVEGLEFGHVWLPGAGRDPENGRKLTVDTGLAAGLRN
jgi:hypothetical protein